MKRCTLCGATKAVDNFHVGNGSHGRVGRCKPCRKGSRSRSLELHNLTQEQYDAILGRQGGTCFFCQRSTGLVVDHDHACCDNSNGRSCGRCVRGLLCRVHNTAVWNFGDDRAGALRLLAYHDSLVSAAGPETVGLHPTEGTAT